MLNRIEGNNNSKIHAMGVGQPQPHSMSIDHFPPGPGCQATVAQHHNSSFSGIIGSNNQGSNLYPNQHQPLVEARSSIGRSFDNYMKSQSQGHPTPNAQKSSGIRPVASKNIP